MIPYSKCYRIIVSETTYYSNLLFYGASNGSQNTNYFYTFLYGIFSTAFSVGLVSLKLFDSVSSS